MTKFQTKVIGAFERHEQTKAAAGWVMSSNPSYRWTKGDKQVRLANHGYGWALIQSDDLSAVCSTDVRAGKFVVAQTNGYPEELLAYA